VRVSYKVAPGVKGLKEFHGLLEKTRDIERNDKLTNLENHTKLKKNIIFFPDFFFQKLTIFLDIKKLVQSNRVQSAETKRKDHSPKSKRRSSNIPAKIPASFHGSCVKCSSKTAIASDPPHLRSQQFHERFALTVFLSQPT